MLLHGLHILLGVVEEFYVVDVVVIGLGVVVLRAVQIERRNRVLDVQVNLVERFVLQENRQGALLFSTLHIYEILIDDAHPNLEEVHAEFELRLFLLQKLKALNLSLSSIVLLNFLLSEQVVSLVGN